MPGLPICVVTGGRGFAARHLVLQLLASDKWIVRIMDLAPQIVLEEEEKSGMLGEALASGKAQYVCADLRDKGQVLEACKGALAVFHMAAPDSSINNFNLHYNVTVKGTRNIINACLSGEVKKLIYTSSPSAIFDGVHGIVNGDEMLPYPDKYNDVYSETKAQAEALVLAANGKLGLATCALRPSSIFGPGDRLLVPSLVAAAKAGRMKFILGDGKNMYDFTYVENVAHAHICAEQALVPEKCHGEDVAAGKAYFITNLEPKRFWEFVSEILEGLGYDSPKFHLPIKVLMPLAYLVEWAYARLPIFGGSPPQFTPSRLRLVTSWRTFNSERAVKLLGYAPIVPLEEGIRRTIDSYSHLRAEAQDLKSQEVVSSSKAHKILGGGKVADLLLWKNEKHTFATALAVSALLYFFLSSGLTLLSAASRLLLFLTIAAFFQKNIPPSIYGIQIPKISDLTYEVSEEAMNIVIQSSRNFWNVTWDIVMDVVERRNWRSFVKVIVFAHILKILGRYTFSTVMVTVVAALFIVFYVYDKKEEEIDGIGRTIMEYVDRGQAFVMAKIPVSVKDHTE